MYPRHRMRQDEPVIAIHFRWCLSHQFLTNQGAGFAGGNVPAAAMAAKSAPVGRDCPQRLVGRQKGLPTDGVDG